MKKEIAIYKGLDGEIVFNVDNETETIWGRQSQIADLFDIDRTVVGRHIKNIMRDGEVDEESNVQKMHISGSDRPVAFYSLDMILAVGYRVNSGKAIRFRRWASQVLKKYIVDGVAVNSRRVKSLEAEKLAKLEKTLAVVQRLIRDKELAGEEARGVLEVISNYALSWELLEKYDEGKIVFPKIKSREEFRFSYEYCLELVEELKRSVDGGELFGKMRDGSFEGATQTIYQTFGGRELYATVAEKAANLLYMVIKDHPFYDGNKRIGAFLFIVFLTKNGLNLTEKDECKISDRALVAITLMIAESRPEEKDLITAMVGKLLEEK